MLRIEWMASAAAECLVIMLLVLALPVGRTHAQATNLGAQVFTLGEPMLGGASQVSVDQMGIVYAGTFDERVYRIRPDGSTDVFASGQYGATGNSVDPMGNLYQASFHGGYVTKIDRHGNQEIIATGLSTPTDLVYSNGDLYVANCGANSIMKVTAEGAVSTFVQGSDLNCPNGIALASDGHMYVVNFSDSKLFRLSHQGRLTLFSELPDIRNLITEMGGYLYVASVSGRRIHRVSLVTGEITHVAGSGEKEARDGHGLEAGFTGPNGIEGFRGNRLYLTDIRQPEANPDGTRAATVSVLRMVALPSLRGILGTIGDEQGFDAMAEEYRRLRKDPATAALLDEAEMNSFAWETMPILPAGALRIFELNLESYPDSWRAHHSLGQAHAVLGHPEEAIRSLTRSLAIHPDNEEAAQQLRELRGGG